MDLYGHIRDVCVYGMCKYILDMPYEHMYHRYIGNGELLALGWLARPALRDLMSWAIIKQVLIFSISVCIPPYVVCSGCSTDRFRIPLNSGSKYVNLIWVFVHSSFSSTTSFSA